MRATFALALAGLAAGCSNPSTGGHGAIEITGYLDAERVSFANHGAEVLALGADDATDPGALVVLADETTSEEVEGTASEAGGFVLSVAAVPGDRLSLSVDGAPASDLVAHDVDAGTPFPDHHSIDVHADPHDASLAWVIVTFPAPRTDGRVWAANLHDTVVVLDVPGDGTVHQGEVPATEGATVVLTWVPDTGTPSDAVDAVVAPAP